MMNNIVEGLLDKIKIGDITWTSLEFLKKFLKEGGRSLRDIKVLHLYAIYLQENKFLFDCSSTYFSISDGILYMLSKGLNSLDYRFDKFELSEENAEWLHIDANINILLRLKNAIILTNSDSELECRNVISALEQYKDPTV